MSSEETPKLFHALAVETSKILKLAEEQKKDLSQVPEEVREFVREQLVWTAEKLRQAHGLTPAQIRLLIREMLTVSV